MQNPEKLSAERPSAEYNFGFNQWLLGSQMLFVAFGALVLVPLLTGMDPNVALFTAGVGTLIFQLCTQGKVPIFLGSSFAFVAPIIYGVETWGMAATLSGLTIAGVSYVLLSLTVRLKGRELLDRFLPPLVTGPVIMIIGLILAPVGINMALGRSSNGEEILMSQDHAIWIAGAALASTVFVTLLGKGLMRIVPILLGVLAGYGMALLIGQLENVSLVDFSMLANTPWISVPNFVAPQWNLHAIIFMLPVTLAPAIEHLGDVFAIGEVTGKDYVKDPGIDKTLMGDGLATSFAGLCGGPPNTTYSAVTGAVAITGAFNPAIMTWAAIWAIAFSFVGKLGALLQSIPVPVMGGIMILLFGAITVIGLMSVLRSSEDLLKPRNLILVSLILIPALGGLEVTIGNFTLAGIGLAATTGVLLNIILPMGEKGLNAST